MSPMRLRTVPTLVLLLIVASSSLPLRGLTSVVWGDERPRVVLTEEAKRIHSAGFVFDGHNDLPWAIRTDFASLLDRADLSQHVPKLHTDIPRLRQGNVGAQFWSVYVPASASEDGTALLKTLEQIELVRAVVKRYPETFELARTA
ncbi:membrane dipeptidase, partial [Schlesneria sp.]|uniref:membrane dipeptidase n=1 Tax=Schlesneria sp. TaxID=2762018 RepID=UPI002F1A3E3B